MAGTIADWFDLSGKSVVITGAGGALCGTLARALGESGMKVAVPCPGVRNSPPSRGGGLQGPRS